MVADIAAIQFSSVLITERQPGGSLDCLCTAGTHNSDRYIGASPFIDSNEPILQYIQKPAKCRRVGKDGETRLARCRYYVASIGLLSAI